MPNNNTTPEAPLNDEITEREQSSENKSKKEQAQKRLEEVQALYKIGGTDEIGRKITDIYVKTPDYVIYEIETKKLSQSLRINIYKDIKEINSEKYENLRNKLKKVYAEIAKIREALYKSSDASAVKAQAASFISLALDDNEYEDKKAECEKMCKEKCMENSKRDCKNCPKHSDCAEYELKKLVNYIDNRYKDQFKQKFNHLAIIGFISFLLISLSFIAHYHFFCGFFDSIKDFIYIAAAGSIGGFISVSIGIKKINFFKNDEDDENDKNNAKHIGCFFFFSLFCKKNKNKNKVSRIYFFLYGLERAFVSIFSAIIIYIVLKSNILNIIKVDDIFGFIAFGFAAGFSERFIPNVLKSVEKKGTQENE